MPQKLITVEETAKALGMGRAKTWSLISRGEIRSIKVIGSRRVPIAAVDEFIARLEQEQHTSSVIKRVPVILKEEGENANAGQ